MLWEALKRLFHRLVLSEPSNHVTRSIRRHVDGSSLWRASPLNGQTGRKFTLQQHIFEKWDKNVLSWWEEKKNPPSCVFMKMSKLLAQDSLNGASCGLIKERIHVRIGTRINKELQCTSALFNLTLGLWEQAWIVHSVWLRRPPVGGQTAERQLGLVLLMGIFMLLIKTGQLIIN